MFPETRFKPFGCHLMDSEEILVYITDFRIVTQLLHFIEAVFRKAYHRKVTTSVKIILVLFIVF